MTDFRALTTHTCFELYQYYNSTSPYWKRFEFFIQNSYTYRSRKIVSKKTRNALDTCSARGIDGIRAPAAHKDTFRKRLGGIVFWSISTESAIRKILPVFHQTEVFSKNCVCDVTSHPLAWPLDLRVISPNLYLALSRPHAHTQTQTHAWDRHLGPMRSQKLTERMSWVFETIHDFQGVCG